MPVIAGFNPLHSNTERWDGQDTRQNCCSAFSTFLYLCVCIYIVYQMSKHLSALTTKDCTEKHMDRYPLQSDTAGIDTHTYTLPKQCVKACLSHSALKLVWATTHNPPHSLPGSPQTIKASINKPATHQLAHYSMVTPETAPLILQYRLCEGNRLKGREQKERQKGKMPLCPLCMSGLSLFQMIHRPQQRSTLELFECGMIIMKGLNVSLCAGGGTNVLIGQC